MKFVTTCRTVSCTLGAVLTNNTQNKTDERTKGGTNRRNRSSGKISGPNYTQNNTQRSHGTKFIAFFLYQVLKYLIYICDDMRTDSKVKHLQGFYNQSILKSIILRFF